MKKTVKFFALVLSVILLLQTFVFPGSAIFKSDKEISYEIPVGEGALTKMTLEQTGSAAQSPVTHEDRTRVENSLIIGEDDSLRSENVKHFRHQDGTYTAAIYPEPVHFRDSTGIYQDYDMTLRLNDDKLSSSKQKT